MAFWICTVGILSIITGVACYKPYLGIVFVIISIPFEGCRITDNISIYPIEVVLGIIVFVLIIRGIFDGYNNYFGNMKLVYCCIPFVMCILLSAVKSIDLSLTVKGIVRWLELFLVFYLTINLIKDKKKMRIILYSMLLTVAIVSVLEIINYLSSIDTNVNIGDRVCLFFGNVNPFAGYVNLIIPVILGMMLVSVFLWERIVLGLLMLFSIIPWIFLFSKSAYLSLILSILIVFLLVKARKVVFLPAKSKKAIFPVLAIFFALSVIVFLFSDIREDFMDRVRLQQSLTSLGFRATCFSVGFNMLRDNFILGIGIGSYPLLIAVFTKNFYLVKHHLHNLYLQVFVETGLMGLSAFVFWLVCITKYLVNSFKLLENSSHYWLFVGLVGGVIVYLFNNLTDVLVVHGIHLQWGIILGLAVVLTQFRESETCPKTV
jgi:O-antigen ligase